MARRKKGSKYRQKNRPITMNTTALKPASLSLENETKKETAPVMMTDKENVAISNAHQATMDSWYDSFDSIKKDNAPPAAQNLEDNKASPVEWNKSVSFASPVVSNNKKKREDCSVVISSSLSMTNTPDKTEKDDSLLVLDTSDIDEDDDDNNGFGFKGDDSAHRSLSPYTPAESFFLTPSLGTSHISAFAVASQIHRSAGSRTGTSIATDEFGTAIENESDFSNTTTPAFDTNLFGKDVLIISQEPIPEDSLEYEEAESNSMSVRSSYQSTVPKAPEEEHHPDVATHVYEGAKGIWSWGKGVAIVSTFLGMAEGVAGQVLKVAGTSMSELDGNIKPKVAGLDADVVNPALEKVLKFLFEALEKGDETLRPIIMQMIGPVLKMIEDKKEETPEVTPGI